MYTCAEEDLAGMDKVDLADCNINGGHHLPPLDDRLP